MFPVVYENTYVNIREGKASFYYDKWLESGPLVDPNFRLTCPQLNIQECWENGK